MRRCRTIRATQSFTRDCSQQRGRRPPTTRLSSARGWRSRARRRIRLPSRPVNTGFPTACSTAARAREWWGSDVTSFFDGSSTSARVSGVICSSAYDECPRTEVTAMALEYGTYPMEQVLQAFRAEHWLHNHRDAPSTQRDEIKRRMRDMFYIDSDDWKAAVYTQARTACMTAVTRLASTPVRV